MPRGDADATPGTDPGVLAPPSGSWATAEVPAVIDAPADDPSAPTLLPGRIHDDLAQVAFLVGTWRGVGVGGYREEPGYQFGQEIEFSHDGQPFLHYRSRTWLIDEAGEIVRPAEAESGFWLVNADGTMTVLLTHSTGHVEVWAGRAFANRAELRTGLVWRLPDAREVEQGHRLYGFVDGSLMYAHDIAADGQPLASHRAATLHRVG